jgi:acyl dehydratase
MHDPRDSGASNPVARTPIAVASEFARALDEGDLGRVSHLLSPECECRDGALLARGAEAVVAVYRAAASWAERGFDDVRHVSTVTAGATPTVRLEVDSMLMRMPGRWHRLHHTRELGFDGSGFVVTIVHSCAREAAEAFQRFVRGCDISSPPPGFGV